MQGSELKALRQQAGMSQGQLDEALGLTPGYVGKMERGDKPIEKRTALAVLYIVERAQGGYVEERRDSIECGARRSRARFQL